MHILLESKEYLFSTQTLKIPNGCLAIQAKDALWKTVLVTSNEGLSHFGPNIQLTALRLIKFEGRYSRLKKKKIQAFLLWLRGL